jgi:hypothetical protein
LVKQDNTHFAESAISEPFENRHLVVKTMRIDDEEINRSFNSRSSNSNYSLKGKQVEKVRKNSYIDIAFPVETEVDLKNEVGNPENLRQNSDYLEDVF